MITPCIPSKFILAALLCAAFSCLGPSLMAAPQVFVKQSVVSNQITLAITGTDLPEVHSITVHCSYTVPRLVILDALASTPLPASVISVRIDSAASVVQIGITAAKTVTIQDNATILLMKMAAVEGGKSPLLAKKAVLADNAGAFIEVQIDVASNLQQFTFEKTKSTLLTITNRASSSFMLDGRRTIPLKRAPGCYVKGSGAVKVRTMSDLR